MMIKIRMVFYKASSQCRRSRLSWSLSANMPRRARWVERRSWTSALSHPKSCPLSWRRPGAKLQRAFQIGRWRASTTFAGVDSTPRIILESGQRPRKRPFSPSWTNWVLNGNLSQKHLTNNTKKSQELGQLKMSRINTNSWELRIPRTELLGIGAYRRLSSSSNVLKRPHRFKFYTHLSKLVLR